MMSSKRLASNNNQVPEGYKKTEIGVIPEDWDVRAIGDICDFIVPGRNKPKFFKGDIPWITTPDLEDGRSVSESKIGLFISRDEAKNVGSKIVPAGAVLMSCVGELGIVAFVEREIVINQQLHAFIPTPVVDPFFLLNALQAQKNFMLGIATLTAVPYLNKDNCNSIPIPLPPLPEQKAIAQTLSDVDALIASLDKLIAKKRNIKTATMQQLLTGKTRLPGFGGEWENFYLCDLFEITAGGDLVKSEYSEIQTNTYPYPIYANSVINGGLYGYSSFEEYKGDCITITARGTLGFACYRHTSFVAIGRLLVLSPRLKLDAFFFAEAINHQIQFANESTSVPQLTAPQTAQYRLSIPKLEEQKAIAKILSDMDSEIAALEKRRAKTQAIKQGMMQELLTGRTRLKIEA